MTLLLVAACGSATSSLANNLQVSSSPDDFTFLSQVFDRSVSDSLHYTWVHTGTVAEVSHATSVTAGAATLTIRDARGAVVYTHDLKENGTFVTGTGSAGNWAVDVKLDHVLGDIFFEVKKLQ